MPWNDQFELILLKQEVHDELHDFFSSSSLFLWINTKLGKLHTYLITVQTTKCW